MNRQQAYERRVWRLAHLLASPDQAIPLVRRVVWRRGGELDALDAAHLDRLVILTARDLPRASRPSEARAQTLPNGRRQLDCAGGGPAASEAQPAGERASPPAHAAELLHHLHSMPRQPMEAWVLSRLDNLDLMAASRAMDCSKTATARHLDAADDHLRRRYARGGCEPDVAPPPAGGAAPPPDELTAATVALRNWLDSLDPGPALARAHREARVQRRVRIGLIVLGLIAIATVLAYALK